MSLPSIRECEEKLRALHAGEASAAALQSAIAIAQALLHYVRNAGTPPVVPPSLKQQAMSLGPWRPFSTPAHLVRKPEPTPQAAKPAQAKAEPAAREPAPTPADWLTREQVRDRIGYSESYFAQLLAAGSFPAAGHQRGLRKFWNEPVVAAWLKQRSEAAALPKPAREVPEGLLTVTQLMAQLDRSDNWVYLAMRDEGFPRPAERDGSRHLWRIADVKAWVAEKARADSRQGCKFFGALDPRATPTAR